MPVVAIPIAESITHLVEFRFDECVCSFDQRVPPWIGRSRAADEAGFRYALLLYCPCTSQISQHAVPLSLSGSNPDPLLVCRSSQDDLGDRLEGSWKLTTTGS
mgnify:FL=1